MDEKTKILICMGAATAANCALCFEYHFGKAEALGLKSDEIEEAVDLGSQVMKGAHMALKNSVRNMMGQEKQYNPSCDRQTGSSCCK